MNTNDRPVPVKLSRETLERAEIVAQVLAQDPETQALSRITRSSVLRLAILRGLQVLEDEHAIGKSNRRGKPDRRMRSLQGGAR